MLRVCTRAGGPTYGDNEVWTLAQDPVNYAGIVNVMRLREDLREYVWQASEECAKTGMPISRPMALQFPADPVCQTQQVEGQFMLGADWLVAPVTTPDTLNWTVYLPQLDGNHSWVYWWNHTVYNSGTWVNVKMGSIAEFPLFYRQPITPVPAPVLTNASSYYSSDRLDWLLCVSEQCTSENAPGQEGNYAPQALEGIAVLSSSTASISVNGSEYALAPLNLCFSFTYNDNYITTNTSCPDATYTVQQANGYVLAEPAPGAVPLQVYFKQWNATKMDYATAASSASIVWLTGQGYTYVFTTGYVLA